MAGIDRFACITVAVKDQDEALRWFTEKLGFKKRVDRLGDHLRRTCLQTAAEADLDRADRSGPRCPMVGSWRRSSRRRAPLRARHGAMEKTTV
jgi:catechol 2,3-dioxygenase-like lactoylglutathione lyase family enzyme